MPLILCAVLALLQALGAAGSVLNKKQVLMGSLAYDSGNYYALGNTPDYDVVSISYLAFSSAIHLSDNNAAYALFYPQNLARESEDVFKASIKDRTSRGRLVQIAIFYFNPQTDADRQRLIDVVNDVVEKYGISGIELAATTNDISLDPGDTDYANPKTAAVKNMISAIKTLKGTHGSNFTVTMTPPLSAVQGGHSNYSGTSGAFIPIIDALRDEIDIVCPSNYNVQNPVPDLDGSGKDLATMESHVSLPDMLLNGFTVAGTNPKPFAPLRQDQVCVSAFATYETGHYGYVEPSVMQSVVTCMTKGSGCGTYKPKAGPYPDFRGMLTVSINNDQHTGGNFYTSLSSFLQTLDGNSDSVAIPAARNGPVSVDRSTASGPSLTSSPSTTTSGTAVQSGLSGATSASSVGQSNPVSTQSGSPNPSIDETPEVTSSTTSKKSLKVVAAVVPVVVIIAGIAFIPIHRCRKRRRARRGRGRSGDPSHSPRSSYDSDVSSFVESELPRDTTLDPYIMARMQGASGPLDSKSAAFQQAAAAAKSGHAALAAPDLNGEAAMEALRVAADRAGISITQLVGSLNSVHRASVIGTRTEATDSDRPPTYEAGSMVQVDGSTSRGPSRLR